MGISEIITEQLKKIIVLLHDNNVPYALAGGLAYSALVEPRATMDIDILALTMII